MRDYVSSQIIGNESESSAILDVALRDFQPETIPARLPPRNFVETTRMSATLVASADLSNPVGCRWSTTVGAANEFLSTFGNPSENM